MRRAHRQRIHLLWILPLLLVVLTGVGGSFLLFQWLRSEEFRILIEDKTSGALNASAKLAPLSWGWFGVSSPSLEASGSERSSLKKLNSNGLRARMKITTLFQGYLGIEEITLENMTIHLGSPGPEAVIKEVVATSSSALPKWIPSQLVIEVIRADRANIIIEIPNSGVMMLQEVHLDAYPETDPKGKETRVEVRGGQYSYSRFPDLKLNLLSLRARVSKAGTELTGAELAPSSGGTVKLEGSFPTHGKVSRISGHWENIPVTALLPALKEHVVGTLDGTGRAEWSDQGLQLAEGTVSASEVTLTQIPVLEKVAALTGINAFRNLPVQVGSASFSRHGDTTDWNEVILESKGLVKCVGKATTKSDGSLSGSFQLGITSSIVAILPFAKEVLGLNEHDGLIWMPVQIGGTLSHPSEDFSPRLGMAITAGATGVVREGLQSGLKILGLEKSDPTTNSTNPATSANSTNTILPKPSAATNTLKALDEGANKALETLGGFLK